MLGLPRCALSFFLFMTVVHGELQARAGGWGEPGAMWNPAFGARPKSTSWAGGDQDWQRKMVCRLRTWV